jgi:REP element-mobilizing transposase RayT
VSDVDDIDEIKMSVAQQRSFEFRTWGGKRKGAGRPPKGKRASERHKKRPHLKKSHPVHVILRVVAEVGRLRRRNLYRAIQRGMITAVPRHDFRICDVSVQGNHIHLIVEADDERALARGMQGFQISTAKHINRALSKETGRRRSGRVFADRYHAVQLTSPRQVRHGLCYVRNNWRRHGEDRKLPGRAFDPFSSGEYSGGWDDGAQTYWLRDGDVVLPICRPQSWLLSTGWRKAGLLSPWEVPGPHP